MASRSFKPAQYFNSPKLKSRPSFTRSYSSSSAHSNKSDDGYLGTLLSLQLETKDQDYKVPSDDSLVTGSPNFDDTPGRKRSDPITIRPPAGVRERIYTPLSARGDRPGGYFPDHEASSPSPKSQYQSERSSTPSPLPSPTTMTSTVSSHFSPDSSVPRAHRPLLSPDLVVMPVGKYHPSNYKLASPLQNSIMESDGSLELQLPGNKRLGKRIREDGRERRPNEVQSKLERYQRDMIAQARMLKSKQMHGGDLLVPGTSGSTRTVPVGRPTGTKHIGPLTGAGAWIDGKWLPRNKPVSPKLQPLGSPGPITPFELEDLGEGDYLVARGTAGRNEIDAVGILIRSEGGRE